MTEHESIEDNIAKIHNSLWELEMAKGQPHSHLEVVDQKTAELYKKAAHDVASVAIREIGLDTDLARKMAPSEVAVQSWEQAGFVDKGYVGMEIATVPDKDGKHPENGTSEFYGRVNELKALEEDSQD